MTRRRTALFWSLQIGGWAAFFAAMFVAGISHWPAGFSAVHKSSLALFGFLLSLALREIYLLMQRWRFPLPAMLALSAPLSFAAAAPWMAAHHFVVDTYRTGFAAAAAAFPNTINTIYYSFVLIAWSVLYFGIQNYLDRQEDGERLLRAEALAQEARLDALRLQLNPHFLFNALNGVSTLIAEGRNEEANRMLQEVSSFLRRALEGPRAKEVTLEDELEFARRYLEIEKVRFGERLRVTMEVDDGLAGAAVPPMLLQPLIENAVKHGVARREEGGRIRISATRGGEVLILSVVDDGPGDGESRGTGIGLRNTRERLRELYGDEGALDLSEQAGRMSVAVRIPLREARA